jgi:hypothetical protein
MLGMLRCRLAPVIPDYSDIGAYSGSVAASVHHEAVANVPMLLFMLSFGDDRLHKPLKAFLGHLVVAEELLTSKDSAILDVVHPKDKGPFLYWLTHERDSDNCAWHSHAFSARAREVQMCLTPFGPHFIPGARRPAARTRNHPRRSQADRLRQDQRALALMWKGGQGRLRPMRLGGGTNAHDHGIGSPWHAPPAFHMGGW